MYPSGHTPPSAGQELTEQYNMMEKFDFLLGDWNLEYKIPKSRHSEAMTGNGNGTFKRALYDQGHTEPIH